MDPDITLDQLRLIVSYYDTLSEEEKTQALTDSMELFDALDGWLSSGGFLPKDWAVKR